MITRWPHLCMTVVLLFHLKRACINFLELEGIPETEQKKQAAADVLYQYSQFVMVCIGEEVRPSDLRLHLMKEISGMPTTLKKEPLPVSPDSTGEPSSSGTMKRDKSRSC